VWEWGAGCVDYVGLGLELYAVSGKLCVRVLVVFCIFVRLVDGLNLI
jgi:hypothetical protein